MSRSPEHEPVAVPGEARRLSHKLLGALLGLAMVQLVHLLDGVRYGHGGEFPAVLTNPPALFGVAAALAAGVAVVQRWPMARAAAIAAGVGVALGFILYHGIPFRTGASNPYWGHDGHADPIRWSTVLVTIAIGLYVVRLALRMPSDRRRAEQR